MSSGFVSGGTIDQPIERDDEWLKAQQEIEAVRKRKEEEGRQKDGKSLYEILEQNKGAYTLLNRLLRFLANNFLCTYRASTVSLNPRTRD
jgi:hypothetical protein